MRQTKVRDDEVAIGPDHCVSDICIRSQGPVSVVVHKMGLGGLLDGDKSGEGAKGVGKEGTARDRSSLHTGHGATEPGPTSGREAQECNRV